jgi:hypothetical protein
LLDLCEPWDLRARCGEAELDAETMQKSCWREQSRLCAAPRGGDQLRRLTAGNRRSAPPLRPHQGEQLRFFKRKHILSGRVGLGQSRQPLTTGPQTNVLFNGVRHVSHRGGVLTYTPGHQASFVTSSSQVSFHLVSLSHFTHFQIIRGILFENSFLVFLLPPFTFIRHFKAG